MSRTLASLLKPMNRAEVARRVGTTRTRANRWANDQTSPEVHELPALSEVLGLDVAELAAIIAADNVRRTSEVACAS